MTLATNKTRILVVDDEADVRELMSLHLRREGHEVISASDGDAALKFIQAGGVDMVVLDWMMPRLSGFEVCKSLKNKTPVLMVTARVEIHDIVAALDAGADDYLTKPFQVPIFLARVRAILRRVGVRIENRKRFELGNLVIDVEMHQVTCEGQVLRLTPSEFKALHALASFEGRILSRLKMIELIQGEGVKVTERAIDTLIFGLRKNMGPCAALVDTVRGVGYRLRLPPN